MKLPRFARSRARRLVQTPEDLLHVIKKARRKLANAGKASSLQTVLPDLKTMLALPWAWAKGEYSDVSNANLLVIVGAVLYFLTPIDLVPDFVPIAGFVDDASVIAWAIAAAKQELAKFKAWHSSTEPAEPDMTNSAEMMTAGEGSP